MRVIYADHAWEDFTYWMEHDRKLAGRIVRLINEIKTHPFDGIGKPEPLKHDLAGFWSRRITAEHRLVYSIDKDEILIAQAKYRY